MFLGNFWMFLLIYVRTEFNFKDILYKTEKDKLFLTLKIHKILIPVCNTKLFFHVFFSNK